MKMFLIKFTEYNSMEGEHSHEKKMLLVYAETYEKAVEKIKETYKKDVVTRWTRPQDFENLTIE